MENDFLQQGIKAAQSGNKAQARSLLHQAVKINPKNVETWLWLSAVVKTDSEKRQCLAKVLTIDPNHQTALQILSRLLEKTHPLLDKQKLAQSTPIVISLTANHADIFKGILQELKHITAEIGALRSELGQSSLTTSRPKTAEPTGEMDKTPVKSALFVDFDNIYIRLKENNREAADRFSANPLRWLKWIEQGMQDTKAEHSNDLPIRVILIRRCYLNPQTFHNFRLNFTRSAFSVIDCPPLTGQGKTSSDIHMVIDILDTLQHRTHVDEFIILSGDADFTPALLRLRAADYQTTIISIGPAAEAYKAAGDRVITEDSFIRNALGL